MVARNQGKFEAAEEYHQQSLAINREIGNRAGEANCLNNLGLVAQEQGKFEVAEEYHQQSLAINREIGDRADEANCLGNLGLVARKHGEFEAAEEYLQQSLAIKREIGDRAGEANCLGNLGVVARNQGKFELAQNRYERACTIYREIGAIPRALSALSNLVRVSRKLNDRETGLEACETAGEVINQTDVPDVASRAREFQIQAALFKDLSVEEQYPYALGSVLENKSETAMGLFRGIWEPWENTNLDDEQFPLVLGAGVGYAAHLDLFDDDDTTTDAETVLAEIQPHKTRLSPPIEALYDQLVGDEPTKTPDELREDVPEFDEDDPTKALEVLEARAFARLLEVIYNL